MEWTDKAILLTVAKAAGGGLSLEIFTHKRGRCACVTKLDKEKIPILLPGSFLLAKVSPGAPGKPSKAELKGADGGIIAENAKDNSLTVLSCVKDMFGTFLGFGEPAKELFEIFESLMTSIIAEDNRWPLHYALLEFELLNTMGFVKGMSECKPAFRHGDTIYLAPSKGRVYPRERVGAFLDQMLPVPGFLMGARNGSIAEFHQAIELTTSLFKIFALREANADGLPQVRSKLLEITNSIRQIPALDKDEQPVIDIESRRKRLLALRPLMVARRSMQG